MAWIVRQIITEIHAAYVALPGGRVPLSKDDDGNPEIGDIQKCRNADVGRTIWLMQTGNFGSPTLAASAPPVNANTPQEGQSPHYQALSRFWVWIWQDTQELAWNVMVDLLAAMRATIYGPNLGPQNFTFPTEIEGRDSQKGSLCILDVTISIPMPRDGTVPVEQLTIGSTETSVKWRNDLDGLETSPPPAADIELVIVDNDGT